MLFEHLSCRISCNLSCNGNTAAPQVRDGAGRVKYIDGGSWRSSNWLRYINCSRGRLEENVMVRVNNGGCSYTIIDLH